MRAHTYSQLKLTLPKTRVEIDLKVSVNKSSNKPLVNKGEILPAKLTP